MKNYNYRGQIQVYDALAALSIPFEYHEHPPVPTVEEASKYWKNIEAAHCKNLFFRNHKGSKHYLVILDYRQNLSIKDLEFRLRQGKISFASNERMKKYLGLEPGSVSVFGLINDINHEVFVFIDENLRKFSNISFHPNLNTASLVIGISDLIKFLNFFKNQYEFISLY
jgi:Ala-tRNA(Pro) deacylase